MLSTLTIWSVFLIKIPMVASVRLFEIQHSFNWGTTLRLKMSILKLKVFTTRKFRVVECKKKCMKKYLPHEGLRQSATINICTRARVSAVSDNIDLDSFVPDAHIVILCKKINLSKR